MSNYSLRRFKDRFAFWLGALCALLAMIPLVSILYNVVKNGASTLNVEFLTSAPGVVGQAGGGIGPAIQGTLVLVGLTIVIGVPLGVLSGIYLSEFGDNPTGAVIRFLNDVLAEFPSVVIGVVIFTLIVLTLKTFSVTAGAIALSIIMLPIITRSTEESLKLVPNSIRDASMALGIRRWRTTLSVVLTTAKSGVVTGILLAIARVAGETAPLVFTILGSQYFFSGLNGAMDALPLRIYRLALLPYPYAQAQGWGAALVLILMVLVVNIGVRLATRGRLYSTRSRA
ncbi:MAG TPA: phosphate ABC transporter permease PstA [Candidatus Angelobacter sp.]|nr:phosphate ABC transporter permease PstA [Candidatus Angelobacter sp.]